ncbi:O-antigen translocase [Pragia fontium]|uniref:O-antigen translocase n=1 Tax=Pragia fontium TaxID=82985 RepID=UPI0006495039|nr:O-antigen translocase [Pragia fontium]AKJ42875.1 WzxB protein [Pragia fontium]
MKRLLTVTGFTALLTLLRMSSGFLVAKIVAIYTGPSGIAMLGQVQSMMNALNGIVSAPAGNGLVRYTAEYSGKGYVFCAPWWRAVVYWILILLAIVIPLIFLFSKGLSNWLLGNPSYQWLVILAIFTLPLSTANTVISSVINGQQQYRRFVVLGMISVLFATIIIIIMIVRFHLRGALISAVIYTSLSGAVMLVASVRQSWFKLSYWKGRFEYEKFKLIGGYVLMAFTSAIMVPVSLVLIRNILVDQVGWEGTGHWQAVWRISEVYISVITIALSTYYLPRLSSLSNSKLIRSEINNTAKVILPIITIMALMVFLFRDLIIYILFTSDFIPARNLFLVQLVGDVIKVMSWIYAYPMLSRGKVKLFIGSEILFSITFVVFCFIFVSLYGIQGANIGYTVNYLLYFFFVRLVVYYKV